MRVITLTAARLDVEETVHYYDGQGETLGSGFLKEFEEGVGRITTFPEGWHPLGTGFRQYRLRRFPYAIIYRIDAASEAIIIEAVRHLSRKPRA